MKTIIILFMLGMLAIALLSGCESQPTEVQDYNPDPILTAFLYNGEPVEEANLQRVSNLYGTYNPVNSAIDGAEIYVIALDNPGQDTLFFAFDAVEGKYFPTNGDTWGVPEGNCSYRVEAHKPSEDLFLWAETVIPDTFSMATNPLPVDFELAGEDTIYILDTLNREDPNIELFWTESEPIGGYVVTVTCLDDSYIPLDPDFDPEEDEIPEDSSRVNYDVILPGFEYREIAWILFNYEGWYEIQLQAVDPDYWLYFFSVFRMYMGQVSALEYNVHGGLGIVAGLTRHTFRVYVEQAE